MNQTIKKALCLLFSGMLFFQVSLPRAWALDDVSEDVSVADTELLEESAAQEEAITVSSSKSLNVAYHSQAEILAFINAHPAGAYDNVVFSESPSLWNTYKSGTLSQGTLQSALNMVNQCRYIAGINSNIQLNSTYSKQTSAAALLNALNGKLSHTPARPAVLSSSSYNSLYKTGYQAASRSNLAMGYSCLNSAILDGWMFDGDSSNISTLGHRRWILNPTMKKTGFGAASNYYTMYALDSSGGKSGKVVAWPAQEMPLQYFGPYDPWSISFDNSVNRSVSVTLTRQSDGRVWSFSSNKADGDFYISNAGYGQHGCIIFRPRNLNDIYSGDIFKVQVTQGTSTIVSYQVRFFSLYDRATALATSSVNNKTTTLSKTTLSSVTNVKGKKITVKWKKNTSGSGYQVQYSTDKTFKTGAKTVTIKKKGTTSTTISKLTKGKTYYVRIRTTKGSNHSAWSTAKSVKISK